MGGIKPSRRSSKARSVYWSWPGTPHPNPPPIVFGPKLACPDFTTLISMKTKPKPLPPLAGYKYLERVTPLLERLRDSGCDRDKANNRELHFDRYAALLLLYFFNPVLKPPGQAGDCPGRHGGGRVIQLSEGC